MCRIISPSTACQWSSNAWPWMTLNSYFTQCSGCPVRVNICVACCLFAWGVAFQYTSRRVPESVPESAAWVPEQRAVAHVLLYLSLCVIFITIITLVWIVMTRVIKSDRVRYLCALNMRSDWSFLVFSLFIADGTTDGRTLTPLPGHSVRWVSGYPMDSRPCQLTVNTLFISSLSGPLTPIS